MVWYDLRCCVHYHTILSNAQIYFLLYNYFHHILTDDLIAWFPIVYIVDWLFHIEELTWKLKCRIAWSEMLLTCIDWKLKKLKLHNLASF